MSRWRVALLLLAAGAPVAQARDALGAIDECVAQLDRSLDVGYERIAARCPGLTISLTQSSWAPWLPLDWDQPKNQLSASGLTELRTLLARELARPPPGRAPNVQRVRAVLASIAKPEEAQLGWWARLKKWLRELLKPQPDGEAGWLGRLFARFEFSHGAAQAVVWIALALVVALAVAIVLNELRIAGLLKRRGPISRGPAPGTRAAAGVSLHDVERAHPRDQPAMLLELIATRLAEQDRLPPARALTAREVAREARLTAEVDRARLAELAGVCEQVRYSDGDVAAGSLAAALAGGREVLATLQPRPAVSQGVG